MMKVNKDAYVEDDFKDDALAFAMALGKMEAHLTGLAEKVEMGANPEAEEYLEALKEDGYIHDDS